MTVNPAVSSFSEHRGAMPRRNSSFLHFGEPEEEYSGTGSTYLSIHDDNTGGTYVTVYDDIAGTGRRVVRQPSRR